MGNTADTLTRVGSSGSTLGHVMLATSRTRRVYAGTEESAKLSAVWPSPSIDAVWLVGTAECKRAARDGIHVSCHILYLDESGEIMTAAEELEGQFLKFTTPMKVEVWQSPQEMRNNLHIDIMREVLADIRAQ